MFSANTATSVPMGLRYRKPFKNSIYIHARCYVVKSTFWPYQRDPYDIYKLILRDPRIPKLQMARKFKVNPNTVITWWDAAIEKRIIIPPVFRRKCFSNFREYFYFIETKDPHKLFEFLQVQSKSTYYFSVQTGFCNFQIVTKEPIEPQGDIVLSGYRSDYCATIPPQRSFRDSILKIDAILRNLDVLELRESPLKIRDEEYKPWDEVDEAIYWKICNDIRIPFAFIVESLGTYNDKTWAWFKERDKFGDTITLFFPEGEGAYIPSLYVIETKYDSVLIDIFSELPTSTLFYRLGGKVVMQAHLPFTLEGRSIVRKTLSILQKEELVEDYTNSIVEYHYRV